MTYLNLVTLFTYVSKFDTFNDTTGMKVVIYRRSYLCFVDNPSPLDNRVENGLSTTKDEEQLMTCQTNMINLIKYLLS